MQIAIAVYPELTMLDAVGPYQALSLVPDAEVVICAEAPGRISDDNGLLHLEVEHAFDDVPSPDVLVVGGGQGTRPLAVPDSPIVQWIRRAHETSTWTTSVCTGSLLLGAAGLLEGRRATTHWAYYDLLAAFGAEPVRDRVVVGDRIITAAGASSGIDMALHLIDLLHGPELAQAVQLGIEYDPQPPFDSGAPWTADPAIVELVSAVIESAAAPGRSDAATT